MTKSDGFGMTWATALALVLVSLGMLLAAAPAQAKTFTVTSTQDFSDIAPGDGVCDTLSVQLLNPCTLRGAIEESNAFPGADAIHFDIPLGGVKTIAPNTQLPVVTAPVTIDGYTQNGASENTAARGNNAVLRIELDGSNAPPSLLPDGLLISASNCSIRGLVINRFGGEGVQLSGSNNKVEGNFIGTDPLGIGTNTGPEDPGNRLSGVSVVPGTSGNTIGGTTPAARNIISANSGAGVRISSSENKVQGNLIGLNRFGSLLGNLRSGVEFSGASDNVVGGNTSEASNTIAGNGGSFSSLGNGVTVSGAGSTGNGILRNSIFANEDLGIDLSNVGLGDGVTPNDAKDPDSGANTLQNRPGLISAQTSGGKTTVDTKLNSTPNKTYVIRYFSNPVDDGGPSDTGGKKYMGQKIATTDAKGNSGVFTFTPAQSVPAGWNVTATATNPGGSTSEFSAPKAAA